jgi:putative photosynthetic complex assembly protein
MTTNSYTRTGIITLWAAVLCVLVAVTAVRLGGYEPPAPPDSPVLDSREVRFEDTASGSVDIYEAGSHRLLAHLAPGDGSFIRGVLRALARERRSRELGPAAPFRIARHRDGGLTLEDETTGRRIELQAFGPTNADTFARLLEPGPEDS